MNNNTQSMFMTLPAILGKQNFNISFGECFSIERKNNLFNITIQAVPDGEDGFVLSMSRVLHEAGGHALHTNFEDWNSIKDKPALFIYLANVLEDIFVDNMAARKYSGAKKFRGKTIQIITRNEEWGIPDENTHLAETFCKWLLMYLNGVIFNYDHSTNVANQIYKHVLDDIPKEVLNNIRCLLPYPDKNGAPIFPVGWQLNSTHDCICMAEKIWHILSKDSEQPKQLCPDSASADESSIELSPPSASDTSSLGQNGEPSNQASSSDTSSPGQNGEPSNQASSSDTSSPGQNGEPSNQASDSDVFSPEINDKDSAFSSQSWQKELILASNADCGNSLDQMIVEHLDEEVKKVKRHKQPKAITPLKINSDRGLILQRQTQMLANLIRARINGLLTSKTQCRNVYNRTGHRLHAQSLSSALTSSDPHVFIEKRSGISESCAVMLVVDDSGSMRSSSRSDPTAKAVYAISEALYSISSLSVGIVHFSENVCLSLPVGENPKKQSNIIYHPTPTGSNTNISGSLYFSAQQLMQCPEKRKLIVVLTDGEPNRDNDVKGAIEYLKKYGVEVLGIGIQTEAVKNHFHKYEVMSDLHQLPRVMFNLLKKALHL